MERSIRVCPSTFHLRQHYGGQIGIRVYERLRRCCLSIARRSGRSTLGRTGYSLNEFGGFRRLSGRQRTSAPMPMLACDHRPALEAGTKSAQPFTENLPLMRAESFFPGSQLISDDNLACKKRRGADGENLLVIPCCAHSDYNSYNTNRRSATNRMCPPAA